MCGLLWFAGLCASSAQRLTVKEFCCRRIRSEAGDQLITTADLVAVWHLNSMWTPAASSIMITEPWLPPPLGPGTLTTRTYELPLKRIHCFTPPVQRFIHWHVTVDWNAAASADWLFQVSVLQSGQFLSAGLMAAISWPYFLVHSTTQNDKSSPEFEQDWKLLHKAQMGKDVQLR